jgi:hypothetical protein
MYGYVLLERQLIPLPYIIRLRCVKAVSAFD